VGPALNCDWTTGRRDLIAGLTVAAVSLPQGMAYALIAGVDPKFGVYSAIVEGAMKTWGRVDGLIHNAAIVLDDHFEDVTDEDFDSITTVNLRGTFRTVRAVYRAMKDTGGGRIVTLTSASGLSGAFGQAAYATTKMGVIGMTRSVAWEGMRYGIKVNALAPAAFDTRLFSVFTPDGDAALRGRPPELEISLDSAEYVALLTASRVTPMALALVHRSCPPDRADLRRHRRLLLPLCHLTHRRRDLWPASDRRGCHGQLGPDR
jgi:NAD(P)-dependent dehydrogenase (short-subunit alcohol dehydrogenase family)